MEVVAIRVNKSTTTKWSKPPNIWETPKVKKLLENEIDTFISTGIEWVPTIYTEVNSNEKDEIVNFLENLEDDDDVQSVYSNVKFIS